MEGLSMKSESLVGTNNIQDSYDGER